MSRHNENSSGDQRDADDLIYMACAIIIGIIAIVGILIVGS